MAVALTGGNCHKSPVKMMLRPPNGLSSPPGRSFHVSRSLVDCCSRFSRVANISSPTVEDSSTTSHRRRWYLANCSGVLVFFARAVLVFTWILANECSVMPAISAAWVFCGAKYTNSCWCCHPHKSSKKARNHLRVWVLPAPGTPWNTARKGSLRELSACSSWDSVRQRSTTARRNFSCSAVGLHAERGSALAERGSALAERGSALHAAASTATEPCSARRCNHAVADSGVNLP